MPRNFFKKYLPKPHEFKKHGRLDFLGERIYDQNLWHLNRHSVAGAFWIGVFSAFLPMPFQMGVAAMLALIFRMNMPISVVLVWISNPITWLPIFYSTYKLGTWILGTPVREISIEMTTEWFTTQLIEIWKPLYLGSMISGVFFATVSYFVIKLIWRAHIIRHWKNRRKIRQKKLMAKRK